jgi:hypothetical protein
VKSEPCGYCIIHKKSEIPRSAENSQLLKEDSMYLQTPCDVLLRSVYCACHFLIPGSDAMALF